MSEPIIGGRAVTAPQTATVDLPNNETAGMDIPELVIALQVVRTQLLDTRMRQQIKEMHDRTNLLKDLGACIAALAKYKPGSKEYANSYGTFVDAEGKTQDVRAFLKDKMGVDLGNPPPAWLQTVFKIVNIIGEAADFLGKIGKTFDIPWLKATAGFLELAMPVLRILAELTKSIVEMVKGDKFGGDEKSFDEGKNACETRKEASQSESQEDMLVLQKLIDQTTKAFDVITNTLAKTDKNKDGIIANYR